MCKEYNGYSNYATWATALWLDNEPSTNEDLYELANSDKELYEKAETLADSVRDSEMVRPRLEYGLGSDLLNHALDSIDWREIILTHIEEEADVANAR